MYLPGPTKARLKALAVVQQRSMSDVLADALQLFEQRLDRTVRQHEN